MKATVSAGESFKAVKTALVVVVEDMEAAKKKLTELSNLQSRTKEQEPALEMVKQQVKTGMQVILGLRRLERILGVLPYDAPCEMTDNECQLLGFGYAKSSD